MNAGYVRLSRDDDKRNYVSIENQKLIINQYAAERNIVIDRWYEDDGVSGYIFDRPGFNQLMADLDKDLETVFVKDFSRLGRHNAKVLLLLDEFQEREKHLIVIDDNYDSYNPDDDTIGIKTWYNERYVKDTSKKIRRAIGARQKEGTLMTQPPFGYVRNAKNKEILEIVPKEAEVIKLVYDLYLKGSGYRKIANHLTDLNFPTPSMVRHEREVSEGRQTNRQIADHWSDSMVKELLDNDFYIGTFRLRKRARSTIHGSDKRVSKEEQCIFENHHPAIIDKMTFDLIQDMKSKRAKHNYRGSRGQWLDSEIPNPFGSCLFCRDCGSRLTPIVRKTSSGQRKYYICSKYNTKGTHYCSKAHLIEEQDLMNDVVTYVRLCRDTLSEVIAGYDMKDFESEKKSVDEKRAEFQKEIEVQKKQLKAVFAQKIKDLSINPDNEELITETYEGLQNDILARIHGLELQLQELNDTKLENPVVKEKLKTALDVVDEIIEKGSLTRKDIEVLIEKIVVDEEGMPEIELKYGLSNLIQYSPAEELNRQENEIIYTTMKLILEDDREFTSAKYLSAKLTDLGYKKSKKSVLPYIGLMLEMGIVEQSDNPRKPYTIMKSKTEIREIMASFTGSAASNSNTENSYEQNLHLYGGDRRYAGNGFRIHSEEKRP